MKSVILVAALILLVAASDLYGDFAMDTSLANSDASFWGEAQGDSFGRHLSNVGDVNNDGFDDFIVGAPFNSDGGHAAGQAYLFFGKGSGWAIDTSAADADASFIGEAPDDQAGLAVSGAGDVNQDGFDDFIVASPLFDVGELEGFGCAYLFFGKASGWHMNTSLGDADASFIGENEADQAGRYVSDAGDVNNDGYDDFLVGAPNNGEGDDFAGQTYLILGRESGWAMGASLSSADASFIGEAENDGAPASLSCAGDVNNDGYDDFLIGVVGNDEVAETAGQTYLILGKPSGWAMDTSLADADASFRGVEQMETSGISVSGSGDVNDDGYDDILIGADYSNYGENWSGQTYLIMGKPTGWGMDTSLADSDASFVGEVGSDHSGISVAVLGDVNSDGIDDILIGASYNSESGQPNSGQTYLILGKTSGWAMYTSLSNADGSFWGEGFQDLSGWPVSNAGDVNADGASDFLIAAYYNSEAGSHAGQVYVIFGESIPPELDDPTHSPDTGRTDANFTFTVHYYHSTARPPARMQTCVNGTYHDMTLQSGSEADGIYAWTGVISEEGMAQYHFEADATRLPESGELDGPTVYDDYVQPSSSCTAPGSTAASEITVDYDSNDDNSGVKQVTLYYQFQGGGYVDSGYSSSSGSGSLNVTLTDGNGYYDFYTIAEDLAGNVEDAPGVPDASTTFDDTPPSSAANADQYFNSTPISVGFTANDALSGVSTTSLWYSYEGGSWTDTGLSESGETGTFNFTAPSGEGSYDLYTTSTDNNGNVEDAPGTADCTTVYDTTSPQSSCTCASSTSEVPVEVDYTASDNYEVDQVTLWYAFDGGAWTDTGQTETGVSGSFSFAFPEGEGHYDLYTIALDAAGNPEDAPASPDAFVNYDLTMPQSSCSAEDYATSVPFDVQFTASDAGSGVAMTRLYYRYAGESTWQSSFLTEPGESGTFSLDPTQITPQFGDGDYELMTTSTDNAGNSEAPPGAPDDTITLDRVAPESTCDSDVEYTSGATVQIDFTASDALTGVSLLRLYVSRDGSDWEYTGHESDQSSGDFDYDFAGLDGTYRFVTVATDGAGNVEEISEARACTVMRDTGLPTSVSSAPELSNDATFDVDFEITDAVSGGYGVELYVRFSTEGTTAFDAEGTVWKGRPTLTASKGYPTPNHQPSTTNRPQTAGEWEYTGCYETGEAGSIAYSPTYGVGLYEFFTIARDNAGNFEAMKDTADCSTLYNPDYALSTCWTAPEVSATVIEVDYEVDVGEAGFDHVELWYAFSSDGSDWPDWSDSAVASDTETGTLILDATEGDGYYRFCTVALNENLLAEPFPSVFDCQAINDATAPSSALSGPDTAASVPVTLQYASTDFGGENVFCSGVESVEVWYVGEDDPVLCDTIDLAPATEATGSIAFTPPDEGVFGLWTIATDSFGNREQTPAVADLTLTVDLTPPQSSGSCGTFAVGFPVDIAYQASDNLTEVEEVSLWAKFEDGTWEDTGLSGSGDSGTLHYTASSAQEGTYYFYTVAMDGAGHVEAAPETPDDQIMVDWTPPETTCSSPPYTNAPVIDITYTAEDVMSGVQSVSAWVKVGEDPWQDTGETGPADGGVIQVDVSAWGEGTFGFCTRGTDEAGNVEALPETAPATTVYDATLPESAADLPVDGVFANSTPVGVPYTANDTLSGIDTVSLWFRFNGGDWEDSGLGDGLGLSLMAEGTFSFAPPDGDGTYEFATRALDKAGNLESLPASPDGGALVFDQTDPTSLVSYGSEFATEFPITLPFTAADATSGIGSVALWVSLNGGAYEDTGLAKTGTSGNFEFTPDTVVEGTYRFYSIATDKAGNAENTPSAADATVIFDLTAPVSEAEVASEYSKEFPIKVTFTASDSGSGLVEVRLWASFNGAAFANTGLTSTSTSGTFNYTPGTMTDGTYAFYTRATDVAGNVEAVPGEEDASILVDRKKPTSQCTSDAGTMTNSFPVSLDYTSSDSGSGVKQVKLFWRLDSGDWAEATTLSNASGSYDFTPATAEDGYYEFYSRAYDKAGNSETSTGSDCGITMDATDPRSSASSPASVTEVPFNVSFESRDDGSGVANTALWYRFNGGSWTDSGATKTGTAGDFAFNAPDGEGTYNFYTICTDNAGNVEAAPSSPDTTTVYDVAEPDISADEDALEFGEVTLGQQGAETVIITNVGEADLTVDDISTDDAAFEPQFSGSLPMVLAPEGILQIDVVFTPDEAGLFDATLSIGSDDPDTPTLAVDLSGEGVEAAGELTVGISANADAFTFGDQLEVDLEVHNTGEPVTVDIYAVMTFDLGGLDERHWSISLIEGPWTTGLAPVVAGFEVGNGFDLDTQWWSSQLPCLVPMVSRSGTYTLRMAAVEPGTLNPVSNLSIFEFTVSGEPFVLPITDKTGYSTSGDAILVSLDVMLPDYSMTADFYLVLLGPNGQFWSPTNFGVDVPWQANVVPLIPAFDTPASIETVLDALVVNLPSAAPFDTAGQYALFSALVEPGTLTPFSDIGAASFTLQ